MDKGKFVVEYLRIVGKFRIYLNSYQKFVKTNYRRRKMYRDLTNRIQMLDKHLSKVDICIAYNNDKNFNYTVIKWLADLNFLTAACLKYEECIAFLYRYVDELNELVCQYFNQEAG